MSKWWSGEEPAVCICGHAAILHTRNREGAVVCIAKLDCPCYRYVEGDVAAAPTAEREKP